MGGMPSGGPELSEAYEEGMKVIESHAVMLKEKTAQFGPGAPETIAARCTCAQECNKLGIELLQRSEHETTLKLLQQVGQWVSVWPGYRRRGTWNLTAYHGPQPTTRTVHMFYY
jgi:hypothetical protein